MAKVDYVVKQLEICSDKCCYRHIRNKPGESYIINKIYKRIESCTKTGCLCRDHNNKCQIYYQINTETNAGFRICEPDKLSAEELKNIKDKRYLSTSYTGHIFCHYIRFKCTICSELGGIGYMRCKKCYGNNMILCTRCNGSGKIDEEIMDGSSNIIGHEKGPCPKCDGDGEYQCYCGTGYVLCTRCNGKLYYFENISKEDCCIIL